MASEQCSTADNEWQTSRTLVQCNDYMFTHQVACDVHFRVHDDDGQIVDVGAHKYVLMSRSSVFHAMLCGGLSSSEIDIVDISIEIFRNFIRYLYTDEVELQEDQVLELLYVSKKYMIQTLTVKCCEFLGQSIDAENCCTILDHSILCDVEGLQNKSLAFIEENIEEVIEKENFLDLSYGSLLCIVKSDKLRIAELGLIQGVMRWADAQCKRQEMEPSRDNRRSVLKDIIYQLRFAGLTPKTFLRFNEISNLLNTTEVGEMFIRKFTSVDNMRTSPWISLARKSNVKKVSIYEPNQTGSEVDRSIFNFNIICSKDIMIHAVLLSTPVFCSLCKSNDLTATVNVNGQECKIECKSDDRVVKFSNPVLIKGKTIKIRINFSQKCHFDSINIGSYIRTEVYPMKKQIQERGVTLTCPESASPLMAIAYARYYE